MSSESLSPTEEKKGFEEKKYAIITKETIKMMAEEAGHPDLPDSAAALLGEDISYRLREVAMNCTQYMRHAKRKRMTTEDFNKALRQSDVQPVFGHGSMEPTNFRQTRDGDLHFVEDMDVNLANIAFNSHIPKHTGETTIKAHWLAVEGIQKASSSNQNVPGKPGIKKEMTDDLLKYYDNMTKAILGCDCETMRVALNDLQTNSNIVPLLPYFVNFVSNGVKTVSHDLCQLTKLLHTVKALVHNPNLYLEPQPYLNLLVQAVMYCVLEPLAAAINPRNDHWQLRDSAARLLAQIVNRWSSPLNHLRYNTEKSLREALHDLSKPFCTHYGAVMGLLSFGCKQVEEIVVPHLVSYMPHLSAAIDDMSIANANSRADAHKVHGALLLAAEMVLKRRNKDFEQEFFTQPIDASIDQERIVHEKSSSRKSPCELYRNLYEYFGDSLSMRMPEPKHRHMFKPEKKEEIVKLFDGQEAKSGEELLEDFMEQVRIQQKLEKERREREELERREREKIERERRERERIERIKREEEERKQRVIQERIRLEEEQKRKKMYEEQRQQDEIRRRYEEHQRREFEKHQKLYEEQQRARLLEPRRRIPRHSPITYPNEDEEDDDDFLEEDDEPAHNEADSEHSASAEEGGSGKRKWEEDSDESEKSEEESFEEPQTMAVMSTISDPHKGIKLKIKRQPGLKLQIKRDKVSIKEESVQVEKPVEKPVERHKDRESKHKRKRKQSQKSPKDHDPFDFDRSDPDYTPKLSFTPSRIYSSPGGESSGSDTQFRKSKLTLKLKVPSKDTMSE